VPAGGSVSVSGRVTGVVSSLPATNQNAVGTIEGEMSIAGTSCSNPTHNWSLSPR
jgi:hypothetical protein